MAVQGSTQKAPPAPTVKKEPTDWILVSAIITSIAAAMLALIAALALGKIFSMEAFGGKFCSLSLLTGSLVFFAGGLFVIRMREEKVAD